MVYRSVLAGVTLCSGLLVAGGQPARVADGDGPGFGVGVGGEARAGKWKFHGQANCRCADSSCKVITCDGESGVSYEDARFRALLALQYRARVENGRIEGSPSITIRFEF